MVQRRLRAWTGVEHRESEGRDPPQENLRHAAGDKLVTSHRLKPRPVVLTPWLPAERWTRMWSQREKGEVNTRRVRMWSSRQFQSLRDVTKSTKLSVRFFMKMRQLDSRFLHVLAPCGVWCGTKGASLGDSPKPDRTLSIRIISTSTRGLTEDKQSLSTSPGCSGNTRKNKSNEETHKNFQKHYLTSQLVYDDQNHSFKTGWQRDKHLDVICLANSSMTKAYCFLRVLSSFGKAELKHLKC